MSTIFLKNGTCPVVTKTDIFNLFLSKIGTEEVTSHFTPYEVAAMLSAVAEYGLDFAKLARIIPTKTPETLKRFFDQKKKLFKKHCANIQS